MANRRSEATQELARGLLDARPLLGLSDGQLLARFAGHRDELAEVAFTALVHRHGPMVLRVCRQVVGDRHAAEDAFQATFLVLARRAGAIRQPELLGNWLYGVALRTAREARLRNDRRRRRELTGGEDLADSIPGRGDWPERAVAGREELEVLHDEVSRLPERYRTAVILCELEGLNYQEAALRMHCPVGTVGVRLRRARERLRVRLTRRGVAPSAAILGALAGAEAASAWMPAALVGRDGRSRRAGSQGPAWPRERSPRSPRPSSGTWQRSGSRRPSARCWPWGPGPPSAGSASATRPGGRRPRRRTSRPGPSSTPPHRQPSLPSGPARGRRRSAGSLSRRRPPHRMARPRRPRCRPWPRC